MQQPTPAGAAPPSAAAASQYQTYQQQQYMAAAHQHQHQPPTWQQQQQSSDEIRTLWIGDLKYYMDENFILGCFAHTGEVISVKVIRNKQTGAVEGYGFIEFVSRAAAERVLQTYNGAPMPAGDQNYRLNWATLSSGEKRDEGPDHTIFVGDLAADVTDYLLQETFRTRYSSVKGAKVVIDRLTNRSKGYGFVKFGDESEQIRAMTEMNGAFCSTRPMRLGAATTKKPTSQLGRASYANENESDPTNTTIFVGGLDSSVTDDHLRNVFGQYGELLQVKIPAGKRCGFVQFADRSCAEEALRVLNGTQLGGQYVRLSWGRNQTNKQSQGDGNQQYYYGYGQGADYFGYPPQDPNMYYGGYAGYGNYQQPQQQQQPQVGGYS